MTDEDIQSQYAGYTDEQLADFIVQGIPDWQKEEFQRLLRLRRREIYEPIVGDPDLPGKPDLPPQPEKKKGISVGDRRRPKPPNSEPPPHPVKKKGIRPGYLLLLILILIGGFVLFLVAFANP